MRCLLLSLFLSLTLGAYAQETPRMMVSGTSSISVAPDRLVVILGVESRDADVKKAVAENAQKMKAVKEALVDLGLSGKEISTKEYLIAPTFAPIKGEEEPRLTGYRVKHTFEIQTDKLDLAGSLVDRIMQVGGNLLESLQFTLADPESAKHDALSKAYAQAESYAQTLAKLSGVKLAMPLEISLSQPYLNARAYKMEAAATSISLKDVEISASVSVSYRIESN